jgi:AcrR family transcriptional regulator
MAARADAKSATRERILDTAGTLLWQKAGERSSLEEVARGAGTTVQTVLRHFGSKEGLIDAAARRAAESVRMQRGVAPAGGVPGAVRNLVEHYERYGNVVVRMLAQEHRTRVLHRAADRGRLVHREWVERTFEAQLQGLHPAARERRMTQLLAVCDVYVWKLMRRDMKLTVADTCTALTDLVQRLLRDP